MQLYQLLKSSKLLGFVLLIILVIVLGVVFVTVLKVDEEPVLIAADFETLKFVQIVFRHGERNTVPYFDIPTDPYRNFTYPPFGIAALTNAGKKQMYTIGKEIRERYNQFLGDYYMQHLIKCTTSDTLRSQQSLQTVLAGLFPPKDEQIWDHSIHWQPIPYHIIPKEQDAIFRGVFCPGYKKLYFELLNSPEILAIYQNQTIFDYVSLHTGSNMTTPAQLQAVYDILKHESKFGLVLPKWTKKVFPDELNKWANIAYDIYVRTDPMKRIFVGYLFKQLLQEIYDKIDDKLEENFSLYSGHDINVLGIGTTLNLLEAGLIPFGGSILIELHEINNNYTLKFYYADFSRSKSKVQQQLNTPMSISVEDFSKFIEKYLPEDHECGPGPDYTFDL